MSFGRPRAPPPLGPPPPAGKERREGASSGVCATLFDPLHLFDLPHDDDSKEAGVLQFGLGWTLVEEPLTHAGCVDGFLLFKRTC
eukprot:4339491-Pyramimonas_sp.AAC.1